MPRPKREVPIERYTVMTMAEVGRELGVTPQRVSQLEKSALEKIRRAFLGLPAAAGLRLLNREKAPGKGRFSRMGAGC